MLIVIFAFGCSVMFYIIVEAILHWIYGLYIKYKDWERYWDRMSRRKKEYAGTKFVVCSGKWKHMPCSADVEYIAVVDIEQMENKESKFQKDLEKNGFVAYRLSVYKDFFNGLDKVRIKDYTKLGVDKS